MKNHLNTATKLKEIKDNYFVRMMLPDAEEKAQAYVSEEITALTNLMGKTENLTEMNFIVIGSGTLWYIDLAYEKVLNYVAVEPLANIFIQKQVSFILKKHSNIRVIAKEFGDFSEAEIPNNNSIFLFHFNILSYIVNPLERINKYLKKGDILYISSWNNSPNSKAVRKKYFDYLNLNTDANQFKINPTEELGLCNLEEFPFNELKHYSKHERVTGEITDILIIYC